jgi:hypothetical protein
MEPQQRNSSNKNFRMNRIEIGSSELPGLYQAADEASLSAQSSYFWALRLYLILLVAAAYVSFAWPNDSLGAIASAALFLITLGILIALKVNRPDDLWYNGRAVAESVKTRAWRFMMKAEPYNDSNNEEIEAKQFVSDLRAILDQNRNLSKELGSSAGVKEAITSTMLKIRSLQLEERIDVYKEQRILNQSNWYSMKSIWNKRRARQWFWASVGLHSAAILMLLYRIKDPSISLPVEVIATAAGAVLTWLQAKKHNELNSSYALAAHEIMLIKGEALSVHNEREFSDFVLASELAFSREHTQWIARKAE